MQWGKWLSDDINAAYTRVYYGHRVQRGGCKTSFGPDRNNVMLEDAFGKLLEHLARNTKERPVVTLDDGYRDNVEVALPLVEKYKIPLVIFVTSGFVSGDRVPFEYELASVIATNNEVREPDGTSRTCRSEDEKERAFEEIRVRLKMYRTEARDRIMDEIKTRAVRPGDWESPEFLDWNQLREIARHPLVEVGAHTVTHPMLTRVSLREAWCEIHGAKLEIESRIRTDVKLFAYPYGARNVLIDQIARMSGYRAAFATDTVRSKRRRNRYAIPRVDAKVAAERIDAPAFHRS